MKQKEVPEMDDVEEIISKISEDSPYKRRPTQKRTWMTVPEMGKLLGLKKTDRYWLVHKNVFESKEIAGKIRINIASFEKWYANQIKYHKVTGEEPGKELKSWSYSVKEVADLLGVDDYLVYELLKKNQIEAVIVDYWKRIPKESFQNWYKSQSRYRTKEDREKDALLEDATITMPEMAQLFGTTRSAVYTILDNLVLEPKVHSLPGIIMEFKATKNDDGLSASADETLKQIEDKHYDTDMKDRGIKEIVKYGIAFAGKNVEIANG